MKRFLTTSFIALALVIGAMGVAPVAHADALGTANGSICDIVAGSGKADGVMQNGVCVAPANYTSQSTAAANTPTDNKSTLDEAYDSVMTKIVSLFAWLVGVAALTLDYTVYYTVISMGSYVSKLTAIGVTWRILRDIGNIALIFGFLAIGITTILNVGWYGGGKKMLPMLLVAAVFLNFSLFFSEAVIDVGNLFATQFYTQINGGVPPTALSLSTVSVANEGISNKLMSQLGLQSIYGNGVTNTAVFKNGAPWYIGFMGIILFIITAFVMFSLSFILITRFIYLVYLIIIAPIGFAGLAIPQLAGKAKDWWHSLFAQTITAPVLLLLLYIALAVITDAQFLTGLGGGSAGAATGFVENSNLPGFAGYLLSFIVAMGLMFAVTISAKGLSAKGASWATETAGKLTFGATAWGLNRTVGRVGYFASRGLRQSKTFNKINAVTGRVMTRTLDRAAAGSFDVRGATIGGGLKGLNIEAGTATKGGFGEARKQGIKEHEEEAKRIEEAHKEALRDTKVDKIAIADAEEKRLKAEEARKTAEGIRDAAQTAEKEAKKRQLEDKAEVDRLVAIDTADRNSGRISSVGDDALRAAKQKSETSTANFTAATSNLAKAANDLKGATDAETSATKVKTTAEGASETRMKESIKAGKIAYAEGIDHPLNPINLVAYGPGTGAAVKKIKDSLKEKSKEKKAYEAMKKALEAEEPKEESKGEKPKEEASKPEAAAH